MMPRLRLLRAPGTRAARFDPRQRQLESLAGEFALLAQRRARIVHQLQLLDQQRAAAADTLHKVLSRLAWLLEHIDALDPELRDPEAFAAPEPEPEPPPPPRSLKPAIGKLPPAGTAVGMATVGKAAVGKVGPGRPWVAARPGPGPRGIVGKWRASPQP